MCNEQLYVYTITNRHMQRSNERQVCTLRNVLLMGCTEGNMGATTRHHCGLEVSARVCCSDAERSIRWRGLHIPCSSAFLAGAGLASQGWPEELPQREHDEDELHPQ